jgi:putative SOS response-associated peptidase YedK
MILDRRNLEIDYHGPMCGRFALIVDASVLADVFEVEVPQEIKPRFNIAPTQTAPIVRRGNQGNRELASARWGLVPSWSKDEKIGARMINARGETVAEKPSFRSAVKTRRCLVPASGFYEWVRTGETKQPHFIHFSDGRTFAFAGLWERWHKGDGDPLDTFTIITTTPNELMQELHDRMPVILPPDRYAEWVHPDPLHPNRLQELLAPCSVEGMEEYPVSTYVNRPTNDGAECIARLA